MEKKAVSSVLKTKSDYECPICLDLIAEPVRTPCNHLFCLSCQKQVIKLNSVCPMCRRQFDREFVPIVDQRTQEDICQMFPEDFIERK